MTIGHRKRDEHDMLIAVGVAMSDFRRHAFALNIQPRYKINVIGMSRICSVHVFAKSRIWSTKVSARQFCLPSISCSRASCDIVVANHLTGL